jgi:signal transduction histidine kinase
VTKVSADRDRRDVVRAVLWMAAVSLAALAVTPVLAAPTTNGDPRMTPNWWLVVGGFFAGTLLVQGLALVLVRAGRAAAALVVSLSAAWVTVSLATSHMWVSIWLLTIGIVVIAQQVGRRPGWVLLTQGLLLVVVLGALRQATVDEIVGSREPARWEPLAQGFVLIGAALLITWRTWAQDRRLITLARELRASRLRLVEAGDGARRSLERDLHDGAQQRIVTASLNVAIARRLLGTEPDRAASLLAATSDNLDEAATQLRDVSQGIYPTELARHGLEAALRGLAGRASLPVSVEVRDVGRLGDEVEAAVYFCCAEAVQNATKHAGAASSVAILVEGAAVGVALTVVDDGPGFDPAATADGHGLVNMRDRIAAVGGTLSVRSAPGRGTTVHAVIGPVATSRLRREAVDTTMAARRLHPDPIGRLALMSAVAVTALAAVGGSFAFGERIVMSVHQARWLLLTALALVVPTLVAAWRTQQPWRSVVAGLLSIYWAASVVLAIEQPFGTDVWTLVLVVGVLVIPTVAHPLRLLVPTAVAMVVAVNVAFARVEGDDWLSIVPHGVQLALLLAAYLMQLIAFALIVLRSVSRHRSARQTIDDVRASRSRLVEAGDVARRSLERDLHDGAQQRVVTAALHLATAQRLVAADPAQAEAMLDATSHDLDEAAMQLRDVSHGIYPTELSRDGVDTALRALAARASLPVLVEARDVGRLGDEVEAAVYFCCAEAVQNASAHAGAGSSVSILVAVDATGVGVTVTDDGSGFEPALAAAGHGLVNMRDRIGAVGGTLTVQSAPGAGTTVHADIPVAVPTAARSGRRRRMLLAPRLRPAGA